MLYKQICKKGSHKKYRCITAIIKPILSDNKGKEKVMSKDTKKATNL